jgi:hypothetical protein
VFTTAHANHQGTLILLPLTRRTALTTMAATLALGLTSVAAADAATITSPAADAYVNTAEPTVVVAGATPGDRYELQANGRPVHGGLVAANGSGDLALTADVDLTDSTVGIAHSSRVTLSAVDVDDLGGSADVAINFDTVPLLSGTGNPIVVGDPSPAIYLSGGIPDGTTHFYFDGQLVSSPDADGSGNVTDNDGDPIDLTPGNLAVGHHRAYATTEDDTGDESDRSAPFNFDVQPAAVDFTDLADGSHLNTGVLDIEIEGIDPDADHVTVYDDDDDGNGTIAGTSSDIGADGTATVSVNLADGHQFLSVTQVVNDVESEATSVGNNGVTVKSSAPVLGDIDSPTNDSSPEFEVSNLIGNNGGNDNRVRLYIDGALAGTSDLGGDDFTYAVPDDDVADGAHTAYVESVDDRGHVSAHSNTVSFTVDTVAPTVTFTAPADGALVTTATPTFTLHSEAGAEVHLWLGDGTDVTLTADADGNASYTAQQALSDGQHSYGAYAVDAAGNEGDGVDATLIVDTSTPVVDTPATPAALAPAAPAPAPAAPVKPSTPTPAPTPPAAPATTPAAPAKVTVSSHTLTADKPVKVGFTLTRPGTVKVTITKVVKGRTIVVATVTVKVDKAGKGTYTLKTKVGGKKLAKGDYRVSLQAVNGRKASKKVSQSVSVK